MAAVCRSSLLRQVLLLWLIVLGTSFAASAATTTTLAITSGGNPATTVAAGTVVTLTASVNAGAVTTGLVDFCDATALHCTDVHILGSAQLTASGTATFKFIPGIGQHSLNAIFIGTTSNAGSTSATQALTVTGLYPTTTTITQVTGQQGNYTVTESMVGNGPTAPTGSLSLLDTTSNNASIATGPLGPITASSIFVTEPFTSVQGQAYPTVAGDFNGDGVPDVAVLGNAINILIGNGDGTFHAGPTPTAAGVQWIVAADFNGDGKLDLATLNASNTVTVLLGNGDGSFTVSAPTQIPAGLSNMFVGDFNGDGKPDLVLPGVDPDDTDFVLNVLLGNGDGTFTASSQKSTASPAPPSLCIGDFNGDGKDDIGIAGESPSSLHRLRRCSP